MNRVSAVRSLFLTLALMLLAGCGGGSASSVTAPLSADNLNLIFVVSPDLAYHAPGDVHLDTANLSTQGLQRSLLMAPFLQQQVLGMNNVSRIYALQPMSHLQTANSYPDMAALVYIQQFAMLNQITLTSGVNSAPAYSYPINVSYNNLGPIPADVAAPWSKAPCPACQGLVFNDTRLDNAALVGAIVKANSPGFHVFSAPWETISELLANINKLQGYNLTLPANFVSPNLIYAITITPAGSASLVTYNSNLSPPATYPVLSPPLVVGQSCTATPFTITASGPKVAINANQTLYLVRHAEAHPTSYWEDGNYIATGQWRALALANALPGKISPTQVYSIDPAQVTPAGSASSSWGNSSWSYVRPSLTVAPYAIANNLPYKLVASLELLDPLSPSKTVDFFFKDSNFAGTTVLLAWEHDHIPPIIDVLLASYGTKSQNTAPKWQGEDYDSIWKATTDGSGNLTVDNLKCEGIYTAPPLPLTAPQF
ncbi:hypothetical protein [Propionivibrio sp.]|uniref:hypothetical protein n=1 Tax=Propionivibrio sp. TaxID=2212460 RepID=UPI003BF3FB64